MERKNIEIFDFEANYIISGLSFLRQTKVVSELKNYLLEQCGMIKLPCAERIWD